MTTWAIGQEASASRTFTPDDVRAFAAIARDGNPLHLDEAYARTTRFGRPIVHGLFVAAMFSSLLAERLPGPGTIYLGQTLRFVAPVFVGDTIAATVRVAQLRPDKGILTLATIATDPLGQEVLVGEATVMHADARARR